MRRPSVPPALAALLAASAATTLPHAAAAQSLRGSPASVDRMYERARAEQLAFHDTPDAVQDAARAGTLVRLASSGDVTLKNVAFPYGTPATRTFVERLGAQYRSACGKPLVVTSASRPATHQPANSVAQSVHPTGMAVDLRKPTGKCLRWLRTTLVTMERAGVIEATEERYPPHFHVAVYPTPYARYAAGRGGDAPAATASAVSTRVATSRTASRAPSRGSARAANVYRVRPGDTLWAIARRRDVTVAQLRAANGLRRSQIKPGQTLVIPSSSESGPAASAGEP